MNGSRLRNSSIRFLSARRLRRSRIQSINFLNGFIFNFSNLVWSVGFEPTKAVSKTAPRPA